MKRVVLAAIFAVHFTTLAIVEAYASNSSPSLGTITPLYAVPV